MEAETVRQLAKRDLLDQIVLPVRPLDALLRHVHLQQCVQTDCAKTLAWEGQGDVVEGGVRYRGLGLASAVGQFAGQQA